MTLKSSALGFVVLLFAMPVFGADGDALYAEKGCNTCHGPTGNEPIVATYPRIAGQNREYLVRQIQDIKDGSRDNGASVAMQVMVANLSDAEIAAIADYLSKL